MTDEELAATLVNKNFSLDLQKNTIGLQWHANYLPKVLYNLRQKGFPMNWHENVKDNN